MEGSGFWQKMGKWWRYSTDSFYTVPRQRLRMSPQMVDTCVRAGGTAVIDARNVTITGPDGEPLWQGVSSMIHRRQVAAWVNQFNAQSRQSRLQAERDVSGP